MVALKEWRQPGPPNDMIASKLGLRSWSELLLRGFGQVREVKDAKGQEIRVRGAASNLRGDVEKGPRWWQVDVLPALCVFEVAGYREVNWGGFCGVIDGGLDRKPRKSERAAELSLRGGTEPMMVTMGHHCSGRWRR